MTTDKATRECKLRYGLRTSDAYNIESKRITWCCRDRHGFMLKHWKCVGLNKPGCPLLKESTANDHPSA